MTKKKWIIVICSSVAALCVALCVILIAAKHRHNNMEFLAARDATCAEAGSVAYWHCTDCGEYFADENGSTVLDPSALAIAATGEHDYELGTVTLAPTCQSTGTQMKTCSVCHDESFDVMSIDETAHIFSEEWTTDYFNHWHAAICDHTAEVSGYAAHIWDETNHTTCTTCGYKFVATPDLTYRLDTQNNTYRLDNWQTTQDETVYIPAYYNGRPVTGISSGAFNNRDVPHPNLKRVVIQEGSLLEIAVLAFKGCPALESINFPSTVTEIGAYTFEDCVKLKDVTLPEDLLTIGDHAFAGCYALTSLTIPDNVTTLGIGAFRSCHALKSIHFGKGVNTIEQGDFDLFGSSSAIETITVDEDNETFWDGNGNCLITKVDCIWSNQSIAAGTIIIGCKNSVIPTSGVTAIHRSAFYSAGLGESFTIPVSVTFIGIDALRNNAALTTIRYTGTKEQWMLVSKGAGWANGTPGTLVIACTDGNLNKDGTEIVE